MIHLPRNVGVLNHPSGPLLVRTGLGSVKHSLLGRHLSCVRRVLRRKLSSGPRSRLRTVGGFQTATPSVATLTAHPVVAIRLTTFATRLPLVFPLGKGSGVNGWIVTAATAATRMYRFIASSSLREFRELRVLVLGRSRSRALTA